jgi:hypothetical protein
VTAVKEQLGMAYGTAGPFPLNRVVGAAGWLTSDRFDIVAKADGDPSLEQMQLMMRSLMAERFKLAMHSETRERPIYSLVIARSDRRLGPGLKRSEIDCATPPPSSSCELKNLPGKLMATSIPMETLARTRRTGHRSRRASDRKLATRASSGQCALNDLPREDETCGPTSAARLLARRGNRSQPPLEPSPIRRSGRRLRRFLAATSGPAIRDP